MTYAELLAALAALGANPSDTVMGLLDAGDLISLRRVERETHEDGDGSSTVWLRLEWA